MSARKVRPGSTAAPPIKCDGSPKISVVVPTCQRAELLEEVVRNVLAQPLSDLELLVVDDGSTDDTAQRMASIGDPRMRYLNLGKLGMPGAVNAGLARASADYVMFLHDHDRFDPSLLKDLSDALDRNPSAAFAFCGYVFLDSEMKIEQERWLLDLPERVDGGRFLAEVLMPRINSPVLALSMVRRSALNGELLDAAVGGCADVELWHRLAARADVVYVRKPLIQVRGRDPDSQFARPLATLDLMANSVRLKERFLERFTPSDARRLRKSWARQIDAGSLYIAWKALEADDRPTLHDVRRYVANHGTMRGQLVVSALMGMPKGVAKSILRLARRVVRSARRSTL